MSQGNLKSLPYSLGFAVLTSSVFLSPQLLADITIDTNVNTTQRTSVSGNITLAPTGSITPPGSDEGVLIDSTNTVNIEANNVSADQRAISTYETGFGNADGVRMTAGSGTLTIGENSAIFSRANSAVTIETGTQQRVGNQGHLISDEAESRGLIISTNALSAIVENQSTGLIVGRGGGIAISDGATFDTILNASGGVIRSDGSQNTAQGIEALGAATGTITNQGTITDNGAADTSTTLLFSGAYTGTLTNSGTISSPLGTGINFLGAASDFTLNNSGTISANNNAVINIGEDMTGNITNSGTITGGNGVPGIKVIDTKTLTGNITNQSGGTIQSTAEAPIRIDGSLTGNVVNAGTLTTDTGNAFILKTKITGDVTNSGTATVTGNGGAAIHITDGSEITGTLTSSGTLTSLSATTAPLVVDGTSKVTGGIVNSGTITSSVANAVDFSAATGTTFTQSGGTITGNVVGMTGTANTFNISGGTINGDVTLSNAAADTVNATGGTITGTLDGVAGNNILNVNDDFTSSGIINNFRTINVNNAGTVFTVDANITNLVNGGAIDVDADTSLINNAAITDGAGTVNVTNNGQFTFNDNSTFNFDGSSFTGGANSQVVVKDSATVEVGTLTQTANGDATYTFELTDTTQFAQIKANNAASTVNGDTVNITLSGDGFIRNGDSFKVIDNQGNNLDTTNVTISQPSSQTLRFTANPVADALNVDAERLNFQNSAQTENAQNVAVALDGLLASGDAINSDLEAFIVQVDVFPTADGVSTALESLAPQVNSGRTEISRNMFNKAVNTVIGKIDEARTFSDVLASISSGDGDIYGATVWGKAYGARLSQNGIGSRDGYTAGFGGLTLGVHKLLNLEWGFGGALSFTTGDIEQKNNSSNQTDMKSYQFTGYMTYDAPGPWFMDALAAFALNEYDSKRQISAGTFVRDAQASYKGWQYGIQAIGGYNFAYHFKYRLTPLLGLSFNRLEMDGYTETGAGGVSLTVNPKPTNALVGTAGVRFSSVNEYREATYVPELRLLAHYDFIRDTEESSSLLVGNGSATFDTKSFKPDALTYNVGLSLTGYTKDHFILSLNYDLEIKEQFIGHGASMKIGYTW